MEEKIQEPAIGISVGHARSWDFSRLQVAFVLSTPLVGDDLIVIPEEPKHVLNLGTILSVVCMDPYKGRDFRVVTDLSDGKELVVELPSGIRSRITGKHH